MTTQRWLTASRCGRLIGRTRTHTRTRVHGLKIFQLQYELCRQNSSPDMPSSPSLHSHLLGMKVVRPPPAPKNDLSSGPEVPTTEPALKHPTLQLSDGVGVSERADRIMSMEPVVRNATMGVMDANPAFTDTGHAAHETNLAAALSALRNTNTRPARSSQGAWRMTRDWGDFGLVSR